MNEEDARRANYQAYLLRLWRESAQTSWRASLQSTATEQMYYFATVESLVAFLEKRVTEASELHPPTPNSQRQEA